jgi:high-affinity iron transporter
MIISFTMPRGAAVTVGNVLKALLISMTLASMTLGAGSARAAAAQTSPRLLVHLLDYLAKDYGGAVENGQVKSESEYAEQVEFSKTARANAQGVEVLAKDAEVASGVERLAALIAAKADPQDVATLARSLQARVIELADLEVAPARWPSRAHGKELFAANCAVCHGAEGRGDGPGGQGMDPAPADFQSEGMIELSPFQAFNTARMGVQGTGMPPFASFSDADIWDTVFYIVSLRYDAAKPVATPAFDATALRRAATSSDATLMQGLAGTDAEKLDIVAAIRLHEPGEDLATAFPAVATASLDEALAAYRRGDGGEAKTFALKAYLEGVEPSEPRLRASDPDAVVRVEQTMSLVRAKIEAAAPVADVEAAVADAQGELRRAAVLLEDHVMSPSVAFVSSGAIILREGFEAVLLILALLGVIRAAGARRAAAYVHGGWMAALVLGLACWFLSGVLLKISGAGREAMEGFTALFAVAVLLYVGFWLHRQTEIGRWRAFLDGKVKAMLAGKNLIGLAAISFIAAFRETIETVLFLRAIYVESGDDGRVAIGAGVAAALVAIFALAWALLRSTRRVPIRNLFTGSAVVMGVLAFVFTGKGFHALQEAGMVTVTTPPALFRMDLLGIYPTWETLGAQALVALALAAIWVHGSRPSPGPAPARVAAQGTGK